ncbi:acetylxylan esterase [uncultured Thiothrix sp.]|uniref:acetylxylan esterase n=1 Tax=uncultured Thiothrix sp. TaxID=223185 RepID=UPI002601CD61|nr:acetylxylan esterase [uncultured Thiothrix sp.]
MTSTFTHPFPFDPSYGYTLNTLLQVPAPEAPSDFINFWQRRYQQARKLRPKVQVQFLRQEAGYSIYELKYPSTQSVLLTAWLAVPIESLVTRALLFGHGYGGCAGPDFRLQPKSTALLFPCLRGLSASALPTVSTNPSEHVLYGIGQPDSYILGGCVEDLWVSVSVLEKLFPQVRKHIGYAGISFGGGIGALALPWEARIKRAHLNVPTFGNQPLRLQCATVGSGEAVRHYQTLHPEVLETLKYYDAATAARLIQQPMHVAAALFDPAVAPPGQFAIYNALPEPKKLFVLEAGHFNYPQQAAQEMALYAELDSFFAAL